MDPQEITDLPLRAVQHPFVHDGVFKVRVSYGSRGQIESLHARMECRELHQHVTDGTSPTGQEARDGSFYAAQLVHYGLPVDRCQPRAVRTIKDIIKFRNGTPTLHVPDTVRVIERKLKKEFEGLLSRSKWSLLSKQNDKDIETLKGSLDSLRTRFHTEEQELLAKLKPLENLSIKYKSQLLSFEEAKRAASGVKHESGSEADDMDSNGSPSHTPEVDKRKRKETHAEAHATQTLAEGKSKRTRVEMPSEPPSRREVDLSTIQQSPIQDHPRTLPSQQTSYASAERTPELRASSVRQSSTPIQRLDSNPPSGYSRREHRRRELLKHASGSWQVTHKSSLAAKKTVAFSLSVGKIFQGRPENHPQESSQHITRYILFFTFGDIVGYGCSVSKAHLSNDKLKIVFTWRMANEQAPQPLPTKEKKFELLFDRYCLEGYVYGCPSLEEGFEIYGTYSAQLTSAQLPYKWQDAYHACHRNSGTTV